MFKEKVIKGLICLLAIMLAAKGWAVAKEATQGTGTDKKPQWEEYVSKEILFIPWGSRKGEVGLKVTEMLVQGIATETVRYGPSRIEVDKNGNIFIFDEINQRIQRYSSEGKRLSSAPLSKAKKEPLLIEKFRSGYRYEVYIMNKEEAEKEIKPYKRGLKIIDAKTEKVIGKIEYQGLIDVATRFASPLGNDTKGNVYVLVDDTGHRNPRWLLEVHKYNKEGNFLTKIKLSMDDLEWTERWDGQKDRITVDKDGNIYQLLPKKDGVHIYKWEVK